MNRRTQAIIGVTVVLLGVGVYALGFLEEESSVRYVTDLHADPGGHTAGSYTLLGIPQPETLDAQGGAANPVFTNETVHIVRWSDENGSYLTTHRLARSVPSDTATPMLQWTLTSTTQPTDRAGEAETTTSSFTTPASKQVFLVEDFTGGEAVWALFDGVLRDPIQPKPSQLKGHLMPDLPAGALVYMVEPDGYTVGCSSKFLPDDVRDEFDPDGDGYADGS